MRYFLTLCPAHRPGMLDQVTVICSSTWNLILAALVFVQASRMEPMRLSFRNYELSSQYS